MCAQGFTQDSQAMSSEIGVVENILRRGDKVKRRHLNYRNRKEIEYRKPRRWMAWEDA